MVGVSSATGAVSLLLLVLVLQLSSLLTHPAYAIDVAFSADVRARSTPLVGTVYDSFGSSHGATTLRARWREHLTVTRQDIPFSRIRFHGILDDDMSTFLNGQANGALVFDTLDFLVAERIMPTIEIGFMPEELASKPTQTVFHYKGGASAPASFDRWKTFITQFAQLLVNRYGAALVRTWRFEVWNEPNCGFYYVMGCCGQGCGNQTAYFQLYAATAAAIKLVDSGLLVGGPSTAELGWIPEFLAATRSAGAPVDFVSSHLYPTDFGQQTRESFMDSIRASAAAAHAAGVPFLLTEFNAGTGNSQRVPLLDSSYAAAFLLHTHLRAQGIDGLVSMSYWTFTDFGFEEGGVDPLPWHPGSGKFGIQTMYGVKKPVYHAFQFISDWRAGLAIPVKPVAAPGGATYTNVAGAVIGATTGAVDVMVAVADGGVITILLGNYDIASAPTSPPPAANVTVALSGLSGTLPTSATLELIDDEHANPLATWRAAGSPTYPTADEILAEVVTSVVLPTSVPIESAGSGTVRLNVTLQPYAVARLRFIALPVPSVQHVRVRLD